MAKNPKIENNEPTETTPKGLTVPIPKRDDFFHNLAKVAKPRKKSPGEVAGDKTKDDL